jgi:hypothetical protein
VKPGFTWPALIARCAGAADVIAAVQFAREHDLLYRFGAVGIRDQSLAFGPLISEPRRLTAIRGRLADQDMGR